MFSVLQICTAKIKFVACKSVPARNRIEIENKTKTRKGKSRA
nr:MAG TPA: hypothetical protein [Caudoviricetes sp.]